VPTGAGAMVASGAQDAVRVDGGGAVQGGAEEVLVPEVGDTGFGQVTCRLRPRLRRSIQSQ
jgi:hypothetical protein